MSHKGHDNSKCGVNHHPCHTLSYTLEQRAKDDDVIQINGQDGTPYQMKNQHLVLRNITLIGTEGRARIAGEFPVVASYLFADVARGLNTSPEQVSINLVNLKLIRIGIIKLKHTLTTLNVQVVDCTFSKLSKSSIVDSSAAKTSVIFKKSIIIHVSKGLQVKSKEFSLSMESSKIDNSGGSYSGQDCPQFIVTDDFESLVADFSKSSFEYTSLIDLAASRKNKSNVSIIDSIFDDDNRNVKHNGCFSGITLRNTTALIVNSNFTNIISKKSLIKAIASFVTFKECIFSNISSKLSKFSMSFSIIASFNKTNAINNKLNGFNYGSIYLQSTNGIFENCIFHNNTVNGQYSNGGAMYICSSNITVQQCLFKENTATCNGGAIKMVKTRGIFVNCTFEKNSVKSRLQKADFGGAICALDNSHLKMHQCLFKENTATCIGGATYIKKSESLFESCIFERNKAINIQQHTRGGAISATDAGTNITIRRCLFKENTATYGGGAIDMQKARGSFENCTFDRNSVKSRLQKDGFGGAVLAQYNSHITMHQCLFKENTATYVGGATYIQKSHSLFENCIFERNKVINLQQHTTGGAICATEAGTNITIRKCLFKENTATDSGGAIFMQETQGSFENCTFVDNAVQRLQGTTFAGAICAQYNSHLMVHQCIFKENTATYVGGATYIQESQSLFESCIFERNKAINIQQHTRGGAISAADAGTNITIRQCLFKENTVTYGGGAIDMQKARGSFENCTFDRNSVKSRLQKDGFGGAVCAQYNSHITMHQCLFKENTATYVGGATYIQKSHSLFENCIFERNKVINLQQHTTGGAICATEAGTNITIRQCLFKENTATHSGGAIFMQETQGSFENCTFVGNDVQRLQGTTFAGAIYAQYNSHLMVHQCIFKENTATYVGGATYIEESQSLFESCIFERNKVNSLNQNTSGGAIEATGAGTNITIKQCLFKENAATVSGGAIDIRRSQSLLLKNSTFVRNTVKNLLGYAAGGAINLFINSDFIVQQCLFKENTATYSGGAIFMQETRGSFEKCTFDRNSVTSHLQNSNFGGAICASNNSHLTMHQCLFKENTATYSGGATYIQESQSLFENCIFDGNKVISLQQNSSGGAISATDAGTNITTKQCLFKENTATYRGGAFFMEETRGSFEKCTFDRNSVKGLLQKEDFGGALCVAGNSHLTMHQCIFKENTATYSGGAIFMQENQGSFENCTFVGNAVQRLQGTTYGGAISSIKGSFYLMTQCLFMKNIATFYGGACYIQNSHGSFEKCTFEGKV